MNQKTKVDNQAPTEESHAEAEPHLTPPSELDEAHKLLWQEIPLWRDSYKGTRRRLAIDLLRGLSFGLGGMLSCAAIASLVSFLWRVSAGDWFLVSDGTLVIVGLAVLAASATVMAVLIALVTFWTGRAESERQQARTIIAEQIEEGELLREEIRPFGSGPKDGLDARTTENVTELSEKSEEFQKMIGRLTSRFARTEMDVHYATKDLVPIDSVLKNVGGAWFVAFCHVINKPQDQDWAIRVWKRAMRLSTNVIRANRQMEQGYEGLLFSTQLVTRAGSLFAVLAVAMLTALVASTSASASGVFDASNFPLASSIFGGLVVSFAWLGKLVWSRMVGGLSLINANVSIARQQTVNWEQRYQDSDERNLLESVKKDLEAMERLRADGNDVE